MVEKLVRTNKSIVIAKPQNTPLVKCVGLFGFRHLFIKDESKHPTSTFKDRMGYEMIRPYISFPKEVTFIAISYGNSALSMGYYTQQLNRIYGEKRAESVAFVPKYLRFQDIGPDTEGRKIDGSKYIELIAKNCQVIELDLGRRFYYTQELVQMSKEEGFAGDETIDVTEGLGRPTYSDIYHEIIRDLKRVPDFLIVPFGSGVLCNEIIDLVHSCRYETRVIPVSVSSKKSIADKLWCPWSIDLEDLEKNGKTSAKTKDCSYFVYRVDDYEISEAMAKLKGMTSAEPSGAAGFAVLYRLKEIVEEFDPKRHYVVVLNTGNGLRNFYCKDEG